MSAATVMSWAMSRPVEASTLYCSKPETVKLEAVEGHADVGCHQEDGHSQDEGRDSQPPEQRTRFLNNKDSRVHACIVTGLLVGELLKDYALTLAYSPSLSAHMVRQTHPRIKYGAGYE